MTHASISWTATAIVVVLTVAYAVALWRSLRRHTRELRRRSDDYVVWLNGQRADFSATIEEAFAEARKIITARADAGVLAAFDAVIARRRAKGERAN